MKFILSLKLSFSSGQSLRIAILIDFYVFPTLNMLIALQNSMATDRDGGKAPEYILPSFPWIF
jgi:hypothetical protein